MCPHQYVSSIFHKSFIEVNEEGTEAACFPGGAGGWYGCSRVLNFEADHPFAFIIRQDTRGEVLFTGHVLNPLLAR